MLEEHKLCFETLQQSVKVIILLPTYTKKKKNGCLLYVYIKKKN